MAKANQASWFMDDLRLRHLLSTQARRRGFLIGAGVLVSLGIIEHKRGWAAPNPRINWRSPKELVAIGFKRSRVVMMNEAHNGEKRNIRSREVGRSILPTAHAAGVRHIAMEALTPSVATEANCTRKLPKVATGYLSQPEMRAFIQEALDLGWTLIAYEIDSKEYPSANALSIEFTNLREQVQAENLVRALQNLPSEAKLLVWCGNSHLIKIAVDGWKPMGYRFMQLSGIKHFAIDQTLTINVSEPSQQRRFEPFMLDLKRLGGTAGFLVEEAPPRLSLDKNFVDAVILSTQNELE